MTETISSATEGTRKRLMAAALDLFAERGYVETSTREICAAARANPAAVAYHFQTKENLFRTILSEQLAEDSDRVAPILREVSSVEEFKIRLRVCCETMMDIKMENPKFAKMVFQEAPKHEAAMETLLVSLNRFISSMLAFLSAARAQGILHARVDPGVLCFMIYGVVSSPGTIPFAARLHPELDSTDPVRRRSYLDQALSVLFEGVLGQGAST